MTENKQSKGKCAYCGQEETQRKMPGHLAKCPQRRELISKVDRKGGRSEAFFYLRVRDAWQKEFCLDLEMRGSASLNDLDNYLRAIWLECCGHCSRFSIGGWKGEEIPKTQKVKALLGAGIELTHIYDFGTESVTLIKAASVREGAPTTSHPIALMARNMLPEMRCMKCKKPAIWLCMECVIEDERWGVLCDEHVKTHPHDNYGEAVRIVNSPRLGMCGYNGPAAPPY
ncbi:MAG: hypothetical protein NTZ78_04310 [Candidatus Aureabacteria bacterium]|nr:hypothetical protein [Candidatus Auribacterota bacterium]